MVGVSELFDLRKTSPCNQAVSAATEQNNASAQTNHSSKLVCNDDLLQLTPQWARQSELQTEQWGYARKWSYCILHAEIPGTTMNIFDSVIAFVILFNVGLMIHETDLSAACSTAVVDCIPAWLKLANTCFLSIYTIECFLRFMVQRTLFFFRAWNLLDLFIVTTGLLGLGFGDSATMAKISILRIVRVARLVRVAKLLNKAPTLNHMIRGFSGAVSAMLWGLMLIMVLLTIWSILAVEFVNPINQRLHEESDNSWCATAFTTVVRTTLFFFQTLVAGDSWGACTIPIVEEAPLTAILFAFALVSVQLGFTNLVLAIIVDKAAEAREVSHVVRMEQQREEEDKSIEMWKTTLRALDADQDGHVTLEELFTGYNNLQVRQVLDRMQIRQSDLRMLFDLMDCDNSGAVSPDEFLDAFHKAYTQDWRGYLMVMRLQLNKLSCHVQGKLDGLEDMMKRVLDHHEQTTPEAMESEGQQRLDDVHLGQQRPDDVHLSHLSRCGTEHDDLSQPSTWKQYPSEKAKSKSALHVARTMDWVALQEEIASHCIQQELDTTEAGPNIASSKAFHADTRCQAAPPEAHSSSQSISPGPGPSHSEFRSSDADDREASDRVGAVLDKQLMSQLKVLQRSVHARLAALAADATSMAEIMARQGLLLDSAVRPPHADAEGISVTVGPSAGSVQPCGSQDDGVIITVRPQLLALSGEALEALHRKAQCGHRPANAAVPGCRGDSVTPANIQASQ